MIVCFDIGGSAIRAGLSNDAGAIGIIGSLPTPLEDFAAFCAAVSSLAGCAPDAAVSMAITGVVDPRNGRIKCANIPCIDGRPLAKDLEAALGRPVCVANDADCFAIAEATMGAGRGHSIVFGIILGTGVGGGIVIDGRLLEAAGGYAGEWGHGPVIAQKAGDPPRDVPRIACGCGQIGCVDTVGGARGLERLNRSLNGEEVASTAIMEAWRRGDAAACTTLDVYIDLVSGPLSLVVNTLGADIVPAGGGLAGETAMLGVLDSAVRKRILRAGNRPLVVPAECVDEPGMIGAAILGRQMTA